MTEVFTCADPVMTPRDFLVLLVRAQLGVGGGADSALVEDVIDALMTWGLDAITVRSARDGRVEAHQPETEQAYADAWHMSVAFAVGRTPTLAEVFTEMYGRRTRNVRCAEHGQRHGLCCAAAVPIIPLEPTLD